MPERGTQVKMPRAAHLVLRGLAYFTWPLDLDDYLELITPLWSTNELRGRIERVHRETDDSVTVFITPGFRWRGHVPGQYVRIGFDIEGKRHWRAYSLSSDAARPDGQLTITVKRSADGVVSPFLNSTQAPGSVVTLGEVEGEFVLPDPPPPKVLFVTAGSGITPVMAMLRALDRRHEVPDVVHITPRARRPKRSSPATSPGSMSATTAIGTPCGRRAPQGGCCPSTLTRCARIGASARPTLAAPARCLTR